MGILHEEKRDLKQSLVYNKLVNDSSIQSYTQGIEKVPSKRSRNSTVTIIRVPIGSVSTHGHKVPP